MDSLELRSKLRTLAEDLGWLENHCRNQPDQAIHTTHLRLAAALSRNVIGPAADKVPAKPLHIAVVGGAGAGKSTVVNFLIGSVIAEANPQAGYTRHPTAFVPEALLPAWPATDGFLGPLQKTDDSPANRDDDVYQRKVSPVPADDALADFTIWDCPDMTTVAAGRYANRLTEVAALADVIVYVASDERYNDEIPTQYLHLLIRAGKAVVVCLTKMRDSDTEGLTEHFRKEVLGQLPALPDGTKPNVPVVAIPNIPQSERNDPKGAGLRHRIALVNQILALCPSSEMTRERTIGNARRFLETAAEGLLDVARSDIRQIDAWKTTVELGQKTFEDRYRQEYLAGETFRRFDKSRDDLIEMLDLPGKAKPVSTVLGFVRWPFQKVKDFLLSLIIRPTALALPEKDVLTNAMTAWLDSLQADSIRNASNHTVWKQAATAFGTGAKQTIVDQFTLAHRDYEAKEIMEIEAESKGLIEKFQNQPMLLQVMRFIKIALEVLLIILAIYLCWPPGWLMILAIPFFVFVVHASFEAAIRLLVETARARVRGRRMALVAQQLSAPMTEKLKALPAIEGTAIEKLNLVLTRVPKLIQEVTSLVKAEAAK